MGIITKLYTFTAGATIIASEHNSNFDIVYNEINGNLDNTNLKANAAIADSKLAQITTAGKVSGTALILLANTPSGAGVIPAANLTSVAQKGANSDITSLAGLTTALTVGQGGTGVTATSNGAGGVVILNGSTQLPAVSGALLTNLPVSDTNTSNVIFNFSTDTTNEISTSSTSYETLLYFRFKKISTISTITIEAFLKNDNSGQTTTINVDIGSCANSVARQASSYAWATSANIDVSRLSNGTTYNGIIQLKTSNGTNPAYCQAVTLIAS